MTLLQIFTPILDPITIKFSAEKTIIMANNPIGDKRTFRRILKLTAAMEEGEVDKRSQYLTFVDSRTATCVGVRTDSNFTSFNMLLSF